MFSGCVARCAAIVVLAGGVLLSACASDRPEIGDPSPLSGESSSSLDATQAELLAGVLHTNYLAGGAAFTLDAAFAATGDRITLDGAVDWVGHTGRATVTATGSEAGVSEVVWTSDRVYERIPALDARTGGAYFIERPPEPQARPLDVLLGTVTGLAATRPDNPQLVRQEPTARFVERSTVDEIPVDVYSYRASTYAIDDSGALRQVEINAADGSTMRIRLRELGPQQIEPIDDRRTIAPDQLPDGDPGEDRPAESP